ncbi:hypothetical protein Tco_1424291 [Tanacetum coccineum]
MTRPSKNYSQRYTPQRQSNPNNNSDRRNSVNPNTSFERRSTFRKGVYCENYGKEGHYQEECFKIVGYTMGHPLHGKYQPPKVNKVNLDSRPPRIMNIVIGQEETRPQTSSSVAQTTSQNNKGHVSTRMDQLQNQLNQVLLMLQTNQGNVTQGIFSSQNLKIPKCIATLVTNVKDAWIIYSGTTDHISIKLTLMHNVHILTTPILVNLPNGQTIKVTTYGSVTLNANITLHNVYYIPSFTYYIISVSKLLQGTSISLTLTASYCIFQDQNKRIAHGTLCDGLYFLSTPTLLSL